MIPEDFAVFITTHGRPGRVDTYDSLRKHGYTGKIYLIVDNEDKTAPEYEVKYGEQVVIFDKTKAAIGVDTGDNSKDKRIVLFARNACFQIARELEINWFLQMDDDYVSFVYKFSRDLIYQEKPIKDLDKVICLHLDYYKSIPAQCIAMAQNGDFIGGKDNGLAKKVAIKRKVMNTFFCSVNRPFDFVGRMNDDVNTYVSLGHKGGLMFTVFLTAIIQRQTQGASGGMTDVYLSEGTYKKSFYSVMYNPSCVRVVDMGHTARRIHHRVSWNNAVPKIVSERLKK